MDSSLEEGSVVLGVGRLNTLFRITIPLLKPAIVTTVALIFTSSVSAFSIPLILGKPYGIYVMTTAIWGQINSYPPDPGSAAAMSMLFIPMTLVGIYIYNRITAQRKFVTVGAKGFRVAVSKIGRWKYFTFLLCALFVFVGIVVPIVTMSLYSFLIYPTRRWWEFGRYLTLYNYEFVFGAPTLLRAIQNSLLLGTIGALIATLLSIMITFSQQRGSKLLRSATSYITTIPIAVPSIVLAFAMLNTWIRTPLYGTLWIIMLGYITSYITFGLRSLSTSFNQLHSDHEEASTVCGVSRLRTLQKIIIPILKPGILGAWTILFILFFREFTVSMILSSYGSEVMSFLIYDLYTEGSYTVVAALCVIQILIIFIILFAVKKIFKAEISKLF